MDYYAIVGTLLEQHGLQINLNDTFGFACADSETIGMDDLNEILDLVDKYGHSALVAYAAVVRGAEPIDCKCNHKDEKYQAAKAEILKRRAESEYFMYDTKK